MLSMLNGAFRGIISFSVSIYWFIYVQFICNISLFIPVIFWIDLLKPNSEIEIFMYSYINNVCGLCSCSWYLLERMPFSEKNFFVVRYYT